MQHRRAPDMEPHWRGVIADWQASGLTVAEFCRSRKITPSQFYRWKKQIKEKDGGSSKSQRHRPQTAARAKAIAAKLRSESQRSIEFAEVKVINPPEMPTTTTESSPDLLTRKEAASYLGIAEQTLAAWQCLGRYELPVVKVGSRVRYRRADLQRFLSTRASDGGAELDLSLVPAPPKATQQPPTKDGATVLEIVFASGTQLKLSKACPPELLEAVVTLLEVH